MSIDGLIDELYRPCRKNFIRRKYVIKGIDDLMQIDLLVFPTTKEFESLNGGFKYILCAINCFTKKAYCVPLKTKKAHECKNAMESILNECGPIKNVSSDMGK